MWIKNFLLSIIFPRFCLCCQKEGKYLCQECFSGLGILKDSFCLCRKPMRLIKAGKCRNCRWKKLNGLYSALSYQNSTTKKIIQRFKYQPFVKELAKPLAFLIISHFRELNNPPPFLEKNNDFFLVPAPLNKKRLKWRGFNQSEEITKELSRILGIKILNNVLIKTKKTFPQVELSEKEREKNVSEAFICQNHHLFKNKKIILVDDVYTTGSTIQECAKILKKAGAEQVWGVVVARG